MGVRQGLVPLVTRKYDDPLEDTVIGLGEDIRDEINNFSWLDSLTDVAGIRVDFGVPERCIDSTGTDGGDLNIMGDQFLREGVRKAHHPVLGGTVADLSGNSADPCHGRDVDDFSSLARNHVLKDCMGTIKCALEITVDDGIDLLD